MSLFGRSTLAAFLEAEKDVLDRIFGSEGYRIESVDARQATLRAALFDASFGWDERDGDVGSLVILRNPPAGTCGDAGSWLWAKFLGVETLARPRDLLGRVTMPPEQQLRSELELLGRLVGDIFSDAGKTRDAAFWVEGYTRAYNDRASGNW